MAYHSAVLYIDDKFAVALRQVESMRFPDGEELTADILRDDLHIEVVMTSGSVYSVSMKYLQNRLVYLRDYSIRDIRNDVYHKWVETMEKK
jgi:hypothetical protein